MDILIDGIEQIGQAAQKILSNAGGRRKFAITGQMGAGKTTLVQALCAVLGIRGKATSPTFSIVNEYTFWNPENGREEPVFHLDLYRLNHLEEALDIGITEYLDSPYYCFIEWPELIGPLLGPEVFWIGLEIIGESARNIVILQENT
ncbi:MAG: tRNA (adenosine(37)-N6)-threonylcarbamoyltransferase complex ATPase subunit type 1 TsaE [Saprospiraceae bacterium]|jgi:tRNA threonylcarbamoyladenosine biosynthesis protein TsaE